MQRFIRNYNNLFRHNNKFLWLTRLAGGRIYPSTFTATITARSFVMAKRKFYSGGGRNGASNTITAIRRSPLVPSFHIEADEPPPKRRAASQRKVSSRVKPITASTDPNKNVHVLDAAEALRASPDADEPDERMDVEKAGMDAQRQIKDEDEESALSDVPDLESPANTQDIKPRPKALKGGQKGKPREENKSAPATKAKVASNEFQFLDPDAEGDGEAGEEEIQAALSRPPPVNSDYLPLPWKGRLGYVRQAISGRCKHVLTIVRPACALT